MSTSTISRSQCLTSTINENNPLPPGKSVIFINGVGNSLAEAEKTAQLISNTTGNKSVILFYNPKLSNEYQAVDGVEPLARGLSNLIVNQYYQCYRSVDKPEKIRIAIIAHSHGAILLRKALKKPSIDRAVKNTVSIANLGGATLLENKLGFCVVNTFHEFDWVPIFANMRHEQHQLIRWAATVNPVSELVRKLRTSILEEDTEQACDTVLEKIKTHMLASFSIRGQEGSTSYLSQQFDMNLILFQGLRFFNDGGQSDFDLEILHTDPTSADKLKAIIEILNAPYQLSSLDKFIKHQLVQDVISAHQFETGYLSHVTSIIEDMLKAYDE